MHGSKGTEVCFATSNDGKFREAEEILGRGAGVRLTRLKFSHSEIRSDSLEEVALEAVAAAYAGARKPVFVEDAGLFITSLNGFPGTYSAWVMKKLGCEGILKLMSGAKGAQRSAEFRAVIAFTDGKETRTFAGACRGSIAQEAAGSGGFGYDPVFVPEGHSQTFAQNIQLKNELSHRYKSLLEFSGYLKRYPQESLMSR